jgi:autotransporter-associated beta strand protein
MTAPITNGSLIKTGAGLFQTFNKNTYAGTTTITGGTLVEDFGFALASSGAGTALSNDLSTAALTIGTGTLQVKGRTNGTVSSVSGTWGNGSSSITVASTSGIAPGQAVAAAAGLAAGFVVSITDATHFVTTSTASAAGTNVALTLTPNDATTSQTFASLTITGGATIDASSNGGAATPTTIDLRGPGGTTLMTRLNNATLDFRATTGTLGTSSLIKIHETNVNGIIGGWATVNGTDLAANDGSDNVVAYAGYTTVPAQAGTIADGTATNVKLINPVGTGNDGLGATVTTINTLTQSSTSTATIDTAGKTLRLGTSGGVLLATGAAALTFGTAADSGAITAGGVDNAAGELIFNNPSASALIVNSTITNNGAGVVTVVKSGSGSLTLAGTNTYTGPTILNGGTVTIISNANIGDPATGAGLSLDGATLSTATTFGLFNGTAGTNDRSIVLGANGGTFSQTASTLTISGVISGAGSLTKSGASTGILTLGGTNTYSGVTNIAAGTLLVTSSTSGGNSPLGSTAAGTVVVANADLELANGVAITGETLTINGNGNGSFGALSTPPPVGASSTATWAGPIILGSNLARIGGHIGVGTGNTSFVSTLIVSGVIDDGANVFDLILTPEIGSNSSVVVLSGANTYHGQTKITRGILRLGLTNSLPVGTTLDVHDNSGTTNTSTFDLAGFNQTVAVLKSSAGTTASAIVTSSVSTGSPGMLTVNGSTSSTFPGSITGNIALAKSGSSTLTITGATNSFTGGTTVTAGSLIVGAPTGAFTSAANAVNVSGTGLLGGSGSIAGPVTIGSGGTISPGNSPGLITVGGLSLAAASTPGVASTASQTLMEINGPGVAGTTYDQIIVPAAGTGVNIAGGNLQVVLGYVPTSESYTIIDNQTGSAVGGPGFEFLNGTPLTGGSAVVSGVTYSVSYTGGNGNDVVLTVVPEPATLSLAGLAAIGLLSRRRRARR